MAHYAIINQGQFEKAVSEKMMAKKNYKPITTIGDATIGIIGQLINNKWVIRCCLADLKYFDIHNAEFEPDEEEMQDWVNELGENNIVNNLDGLEFKETNINLKQI